MRDTLMNYIEIVTSGKQHDAESQPWDVYFSVFNRVHQQSFRSAQAMWQESGHDPSFYLYTAH